MTFENLFTGFHHFWVTDVFKDTDQDGRTRFDMWPNMAAILTYILTFENLFLDFHDFLVTDVFKETDQDDLFEVKLWPNMAAILT